MSMSTRAAVIPAAEATVAEGMIAAGLLWAVRMAPENGPRFQVIIITAAVAADGTARAVYSARFDDLNAWTEVENTPLADLTRPDCPLPLNAEERDELQTLIYMGCDGEFDFWMPDPEADPTPEDSTAFAALKAIAQRPARLN